MPLTDRQIRRQTEVRTVIIADVDVPSKRITMTDQYGSVLYATLSFSDSVISVPQAGEIWTVQRRNTEWLLINKQTTSVENAQGYTGLNPGDKRIETTGTLYLNGDSLSIDAPTTVDINTEGELNLTTTGQLALNADEILVNNVPLNNSPGASNLALSMILGG